MTVARANFSLTGVVGEQSGCYSDDKIDTWWFLDSLDTHVYRILRFFFW